MTFEEQQDLRILSILKNEKDVLTYDNFKEITKSEDSDYIIKMQMERGLIGGDNIYRKNEETGHLTDRTYEYWITILGNNRYDSLLKLKSEEDRIERRNKLNFRYTIIAAISAIAGIAVSIILYWLSQRHE